MKKEKEFSDKMRSCANAHYWSVINNQHNNGVVGQPDLIFNKKMIFVYAELKVVDIKRIKLPTPPEYIWANASDVNLTFAQFLYLRKLATDNAMMLVNGTGRHSNEIFNVGVIPTILVNLVGANDVYECVVRKGCEFSLPLKFKAHSSVANYFKHLENSLSWRTE